MTEQAIIDLASEAIMVSMKIAAPALLAIMVTGFLVSIFQAATQINEQTLSFIPKIVAMLAAIVFAGPWILKTIIFFTKNLISSLATLNN